MSLPLIEDQKEEESVFELDLFEADPECNHEIIELWSGIKCKNCTGWHCM